MTSTTIPSATTSMCAWTCTWTTGPDSGGAVAVGAGQVLIGRAPGASVRCDDPALEPHHAMLEVDTDGIRVIQLAGRMPLLVDGHRFDAGLVIAGEALIEVGHSTLHVRPGPLRPHPPAHVRDDALVRSPRLIPVWAPSPLVPPSDLEPDRNLPGGLLPALLAIVGSAVLALVTGQLMFLLFGALGGVVALGSWVAQRVGLVRGSRRARRHHDASLAEFRVAEATLRDEFVEHLRDSTSTAVTALQIIGSRDERLWTRRAAHPDTFQISLGTGELLWRPPLTERPVTHHQAVLDPVSATPLRGQPIAVDIGPGARVAICGDRRDTAGVARSALVQLAANCGPADLRIIVVSGEPQAWRWVADLPHAVAPDGSSCVVTPDEVAGVLQANDQSGMPHVVILTDTPELLASRTSPLRRAVTAEPGPALIALVPAGVGVPHVCTGVLSIAAAPTVSSGRPVRWVADAASSALPVSVRVAAVGFRAAARAASQLRELSDPDDPFGVATGLPSSVSLIELLTGAEHTPLTPAAVAARWLAAGPDPHPRTPIGIAADGLVDIDLVRDGPHGLFAGTTGSGKSELLRSLVAGMAVDASPDHLTFVLVDYKGGATFDACASLPHVVGIVTDLDEHLVDRALRSLDAELRRREALLRDHAASDLPMLRELAPHVVLPRLVVVIDEFAALVAEQPNFLHALVGVAQRGRSLGVHVLLATQRPNGVISDDIRANTNIRLALRLQDSADALDVVGDTAPTSIPRRVAGRAVLRLGPEEHVTFQAARCTGTSPNELDAIVRAVREAMTIIGVAPPVGPWRPPLPPELDVADIAGLCSTAGTAESSGIAATSADTADTADTAETAGSSPTAGAAGIAETPAGDPGPVAAGAPLGVVDDPDRQQVRPLTWRADAGHLLLAGTPGSGVTSTLATLAGYALDTDPDAHLYVIDGKGDDALLGLADHRRCAGVVRLHERERLMRLLHRLAEVVEHRAAHGGRGGERAIVLVVDGFTDLRARLDDLDTVDELEALDRIIAGGAGVGVCAVLAIEQPGAMPSAVLARCPQRWLLHLADRHDAPAWGFPTADVPGAIPGRAAIGGGLQAQLVRPGRPARLHLAALPRRLGPGEPDPIEVLPALLRADASDAGWTDNSGSTWLPIGRSFVRGDQVCIEVPDGEQVLILGPARSGRSTALARVIAAWRAAHPAGWSGVLIPRRASDAIVRTHHDLTALLGDVPPAGPVLLAIDDADVIDDPGGALAALLAARRRELLVVATGKPEVLRQTYGHWTTVVRRSRLGLVLSACNDIDGDLLGASVPRRRPVGARPGLAWLCDNGEIQLVQIAVDVPAAGRATPRGGIGASA